MSSDSVWTFADVSKAQTAALTCTSATERLKLLENLLALAAASGALKRESDRRQRAIDAQWEGMRR